MLLILWTGLVFIAGFGLVGIPALFGAIVPSSRSTGFAIAALVGAFCMAGLLLHLLRYVVLVCVGLIRTGELIGASRQFFRIRRKADETLPEPRWFIWLTSATDVDLLVQAAVVAVLIGGALVGSPGAGN
jgi:hypothetical protein